MQVFTVKQFTSSVLNVAPQDKKKLQTWFHEIKHCRRLAALKTYTTRDKRYSISKQAPTQVIVQQLTAYCRDRSRVILVALTHRWIEHYSPHDSWPLTMDAAGFSSSPPGTAMTLPFCWRRVKGILSFNQWSNQIPNMMAYSLQR
jgi:hypothetical protein